MLHNLLILLFALCTMDILSVLEKRSSLRILLYLLAHEQANVQTIKTSIRMGTTSVSSALSLLYQAGLVSFNQKYPYGEKLFSLTSLGKGIAEYVQSIVNLYQKHT